MKRWIRNMLLAALGASMLVGSLVMAEERLLREAQQYFDKGEYNAAIIQLKNALQRQPDHAAARELLGRIYLEQGDGASAEKELEQATRLGADRQAILPLQARAWLLQGKTNRVLEEISGEGLEGEAQAEQLFLLGQALLMRGETDQAEQQFAKALSAHPDHVDSLVAQARMLSTQGDKEGAQERLARALRLSSDHADAWVLDGELQRQAGNLEAAEDRFNRALALRPEHPGAYLGRTTIYIGQGRHEQAQRDIQQILRRSPRHPIAHYLQGLSYYQQGRLEEAAESLQQTLAVVPGHLPGALLLGTIHYQQGQFHQSIQHLRPFVTAFPDHAPGVKLLAAAFLRTQQGDAAIELLEAAIGQAPEDVQLLAMLGSAYLERGDSDKGIEYLQRAAQLAPDIADIQTRLAVGHMLAGDTSQAAEELEAAVNLGQGLIQADLLLVVTYLNNQELDKALAAAQALQARMPDEPMSYNLLGAVQLKREDPQAARQAFAKALDKQPDFAPAKLNLARMDMAEGALDRARSRFQEVLAKDETSLVAMYGMVDIAHMQGKTDEVERWLERARKHHPGVIKPNVLLAEHYLRLDQPYKALAVASSLNEHQPNQPDVLRVLGLAQMATDSGAAGLASFRRLAGLLPDNPQAQYLLGSAAVSQQDFVLARMAFGKVLELDASHAGALVNLGSLLLRAGEQDEAAAYARRLLEQHPAQPWGYALSADILARKGEYAAAASQAGEAYARDATQSAMLRHHAMLRQSGDQQEATKVLEAWLQQHPDDGDVRLRTAMFLQEQEKPEQAAKHYERLLAQQPANIIALNNLAWLYVEQDPERALEYAERAYQITPERPEVLDTYGWALVQSGRPANGLAYLQEALLKAPYLSEVRYHVAYALHALGRSEEARKEMDEIQRSDSEFAQSSQYRVLREQMR